MSNLAEGDEEEARLEEEQETKLAEMEAEMEKEKEARKLAGATDEEIQKALELLQRQHDAKRKVKLLVFRVCRGFQFFPAVIYTYCKQRISTVFPAKIAPRFYKLLVVFAPYCANLALFLVDFFT